MKASNFESMTNEQLKAKIAELKEELFNLRFRLATGQLENVMQISSVRKDIARAMTVQRQKELTVRKFVHFRLFQKVCETSCGMLQREGLQESRQSLDRYTVDIHGACDLFIHTGLLTCHPGPEGFGVE